MAHGEPAVLRDALFFPEGPRWRGDRLFFSDILGGTVHSVTLDGTLGGADGTTLFLCESAVLGQPRRPGDGRIRTVEVDVPGVGTP